MQGQLATYHMQPWTEVGTALWFSAIHRWRVHNLPALSPMSVAKVLLILFLLGIVTLCMWGIQVEENNPLVYRPCMLCKKPNSKSIFCAPALFKSRPWIEPAVHLKQDKCLFFSPALVEPLSGSSEAASLPPEESLPQKNYKEGCVVLLGKSPKETGHSVMLGKADGFGYPIPKGVHRLR